MSLRETSTILRWSTDSVPQEQRRDFWAAALTDAMIPLGLDQADPRTFQSEMSLGGFGPINVLRQTGSPHRCFRDRRELSRSTEHSFNLLMSVNCSWNITHINRTQMSPGDVLLHDSCSPFSIEIASDYEFVNVPFTEAWARQWLPNPKALAGRRITGSSLWGRALSSYLSELTPELTAAPPLPLSVIAEQVGSLLVLTATGMQAAAAMTNTPAVRSLHERIRDCVAQRGMEPQLTAADVAAALNISVRTLHRALGSANGTFGAMLIDARARIALRMLTSPLFRRVTTAEIGRRAGFLSASHFARVMRYRTGQTPLQLRRGVSPDAEHARIVDSEEPDRL